MFPTTAELRLSTAIHDGTGTIAEKDCVGVGSTPDALASHFEVYETSFEGSKLVSYTSKWLARASGVLPTPTQSFSVYETSFEGSKVIVSSLQSVPANTRVL